MKILLTALSAKHIHKTLAPWCIKSYCDSIINNVEIAVEEYTINDELINITNSIYKKNPDVIGLSCYIWNIEYVTKLAEVIKKFLPYVTIIIGGPEVSFAESIEEYPFADYVIKGAGEEAFADLIISLQNDTVPKERLIKSKCTKSFADYPSPFTKEYFDSFAKWKMNDISNQLVYYESSRGCPFSCAYCLSSITLGVQFLPLERVKKELNMFVSAGALCVKFVDRTFNADKKRAKEILKYILKMNTNCTFHFEVAADLFDDEMLEIIAKMPVNRVQFEIGIQSTNDETLKQVQRKTNLDKVLKNVKRLVEMNNCHVHVDLIAGLPFEDMASFSKAIDACLAVKPHMLQLGFLKLLKGSALRKNSNNWQLNYNPFPPYQIISTHKMSTDEIINLQLIETVIDKFYNSGMYINTLTYAIENLFDTWYELFSKLSFYCANKNIKMSLKNSYTLLMIFLYDYASKETVWHYIKLDCLTFDFKTQLPDDIKQERNKEAESVFIHKHKGEYRKVRAEYFPFDNKTRLFIYEEKDAITKKYKNIELSEEELYINK